MAGGPFGVPRAQPRAKRVFLWKVVDSLSTVLASELKQEQPYGVRWLDLLEEMRSVGFVGYVRNWIWLCPVISRRTWLTDSASARGRAHFLGDLDLRRRPISVCIGFMSNTV